jgi:acyl-CoA synthetase (AMP-forming)/AMP-acid ligase II
VTESADEVPERPAANAWWRPVGGPSAEPLDGGIFATFAAVAANQPAAIAIRAGTRSIGYGALHARAMTLAARIDTETEPGRGVATLLADPVDAACAILACLAAGRPCLNLNPHHPPARLAELLADAFAGAAILPRDGSPCAIPSDVTVIPIEAEATVLSADPPRPGGPDAPALVIYTSGSTGRPKGIVRSDRQMMVRVADRLRRFGLGPLDRTLLLYPLSAGPAVTACLAALLSGGELHLADIAAVGARGVLDVAQAVGATKIAGVPALLRLLFAVEGAETAFASLRNVYAGSESVTRQDIDRWRAVLPPGCAIKLGYGLTEGAPLTSWFVPPIIPGDTARLPVGYPVPWLEFAITATDGTTVEDEEPGELWARGRLMSLGEWHQGRCVPGRLLADPDDPAGAILRTGDMVRLRRDGLLEFLGRFDDQIRIRGNRVEPSEVEVVLRRMPGVADAAMLARRTAGDPVLVAFVVPASPTEPGLRAMLPSYSVPSRLHLLPALPKLPGGKIDPVALAQADDASRSDRGVG